MGKCCSRADRLPLILNLSRLCILVCFRYLLSEYHWFWGWHFLAICSHVCSGGHARYGRVEPSCPCVSMTMLTQQCHVCTWCKPFWSPGLAAKQCTFRTSLKGFRCWKLRSSHFLTKTASRWLPQSQVHALRCGSVRKSTSVTNIIKILASNREYMM